MPFIPNTGGANTSTLTANQVSQNAPLPKGGSNEVLVYNTDASNDVYIDFGANNSITAAAPAVGTDGVLVIPAGSKKPLLFTLPPNAAFWAVLAAAGSPKVYVTRGRWA